MAYPIWRDYRVDMGADSPITYRISVLFGSQYKAIYTGRAYTLPGEADNIIKINDICADYIANVIPVLSQAEFTAITLPVKFLIEAWDAVQGWTLVDEVEFTNDWSYDRSYNPETMGMAFPITGKVAKNQWLIYTAYQQDSVSIRIIFKDEDTMDVIIPISRSNDFNNDFNYDFARSFLSAGSGSVAIDLSQWEDVAKVVIGNTTYTIDEGCHKYVLHYRNVYGGWDSILMDGNAVQTNSYDRKLIDQDYDNREPASRNKRNYLTKIAKSFRMNTGWLTDDQSAEFDNVIGSNDVFLENLEDNTILPVVITDTDMEVKSFRNQGGNIVNYEVNVELAQDRIRR